MCCCARSHLRWVAPARLRLAPFGYPARAKAAKHGLRTDSPRRGRYLDAVIGPAPDNRRALFQTGPDAVDYLERHTDVKFAPYLRHPDYLPNRPAATVRRTAPGSAAVDGRLLGSDFDLVRPPIGEFMALGGMMIGRDDIEPLARPFGSPATFRAAASLLWRHATDRLRYRRGTRFSWATRWSHGSSTACAAATCRSGSMLPCKR